MGLGVVAGLGAGVGVQTVLAVSTDPLLVAVRAEATDCASSPPPTLVASSPEVVPPKVEPSPPPPRLRRFFSGT